MTKILKNIIRMFISACIVACAITGIAHAYTFESNTGKTEKAFENSYEQAIEDAVLVSSDEVGYVLSFNGEAHYYTFESNTGETEKAFESGYEKAIEDAVLVEYNDVGYILSFNGELHAYTFK